MQPRELIKEIYEKSMVFRREDFDLKSYDTKFSSFDKKELISSSLEFGDFFATKLLLEKQEWWIPFTLKDWIEILQNQFRNEESIIIILSFLYKFVGVDFIKIFSELESIPKSIRTNIVLYFVDYSGVLLRFKFEEEAAFGDVNMDFHFVAEKLYQEGALPAESLSKQSISNSLKNRTK